MPRRAKSGSWPRPSSAVVDSLVDYLKRDSRWRRDGPVLRLVNQNWRRRIDQRVTEIRPEPCRLLSREDVGSLLKFQFLTSIDVTPFLLALRRHPPFGVPSIQIEIQRLVRILRQLPNLTRVEIEAGRLALGSDGYRYSGRRPWAELKSVGSLCIYHGRNPRQRDQTHSTAEYAFTISHEATIDLAPFVRQFAGVKQLTVFFSTEWKHVSWSFLKRVETVQLETVCTLECLRGCPVPNRIISAALEEPTPSDVELLEALPALRSLRLRSTHEWPELNVESMQSLKFLDLSPPVQYSVLTDIHSLRRIQYLTLRNTRFKLDELTREVTNLRTLRLFGCQLDGSCAFEQRPSQLESLSLVDTHKSSTSAALGLVGAASPYLTSLTFGPEPVHTILMKSKPPKVAELSMVIKDDFYSCTLELASRWPKLRKLTVRRVGKHRPFPVSIPSPLTTKLEKLTFMGFQKTPWVCEKLRELRTEAKWMTVEWQIDDSYFFETQLL